MKIKVRIYQLKNIRINKNLNRSLELYYSDNLNKLLEEVIICNYNTVSWSTISKSPSIKLVILCDIKPQAIPKINKTVVEVSNFFRGINSIKNKSILTDFIISYYLKKYLYKKNGKIFKAYLFRHGETIWNRKKIYQGTLDSQITKKGLRTIKKIAKLLKNTDLQMLFSSPQKRSLVTAEFIVKQIKIKMEVVDQFREMDLGIFEGKRNRLMKKVFSKYFEMRELSSETKITTPYPFGESYKDVYMRILPIVLRIVCEYDKFAIVGHEGVNRLIRGILEYKPLQESVYLRQANNEILAIDIARNNEQTIRISDCNHTFIKLFQSWENFSIPASVKS